MWLSPPQSSLFKVVHGERVRLGQVYTRKSTSLALTFNWPGLSTVYHTYLQGRLAKCIVRESRGRGECGCWRLVSGSTTLAIGRFEKLWETCGKALCSFKIILLRKFEIVSNKFPFTKKKKKRNLGNSLRSLLPLVILLASTDYV